MFETSQFLGALGNFCCSLHLGDCTPVRRSFVEVHGHFNRSWE